MKKQNNSIQTKNIYFFSHDSNARNDLKIVNLRMDHGVEGYGIYFMLVEMLMEATNYMLMADYRALAYNLQIKKEVLQSVIEDFDLFDFTEDGTHFFSPSLNKRIAPLEQLREKRRQAGLLGVEAKRKKQAETEQIVKEHDVQISPDHLLSKPSAIAQKKSAKERKVKERKLKESKEEQSKEEQNRADSAKVANALPKAKADRFVPPTHQELESYCIENKYNIDINVFLDFYQSKGWMVGKNSMKDWRATVRNWVRKDQENAQKRRHGLPMIRQPNITNHKNDRAYEQF